MTAQVLPLAMRLVSTYLRMRPGCENGSTVISEVWKNASRHQKILLPNGHDQMPAAEPFAVMEKPEIYPQRQFVMSHFEGGV